MPESLALLNVYEVESEHGPASLLCFLDPVLAGAKGIDARSVVGEYVADEAGFDPDAFRINPAFVEAVTGYMNDEASASGGIAEQARDVTSGWLYVIDPRDRTPEGTEPDPKNVLGCVRGGRLGSGRPGLVPVQRQSCHVRPRARHVGPALRSGVLRLAARALIHASPPTSQPVLHAAWKL